MIVNKYIKMVLYISIFKIINVVELIEIIFEKMILQFDSFKDIVFDKESVFTNEYGSEICYYLKTKRGLNIVFHSQIDGQIERQNQILKHYLKIFFIDNQGNGASLLSII